jgi:RNA polymerase sigma-70 factor, ECF subfamily
VGSEHEQLEHAARELCDQGKHGDAVTLVLQGYGPEIVGLLRAQSRSEDDASEAFGIFAEDLFKGIGAFSWRSSMRTWAYTLARHALLRIQTSPHRRPERRIPLSQSPASLIAEQVRERTLPHLRTEVKDGLTRLREALTPEEQLLLTLRIDRQMPWDDVTAILDANESEAVRQDVKKRTALHRKRFQLLKDKLRERAAKMGLLGDDDT